MASTPQLQEPRWNRRKDARPDEIVSAALELFVERGYAATRLDDVAARDGVSKGTLYLYFANKEELFKAVVREALVARLTQLRSVVESHRGSTLELLRDLIRRWWGYVGDSRVSGIPKLVMSEARNFPEIARFYLDEVVLPAQDALAGIVRRGIERGEIRPIDPALASQLLTAPVLMISLWRNSVEACTAQKIDPLALLEAHLETFSRGVAAAPVQGT
jgi:AcrR family transcriptional regulator